MGLLLNLWPALLRPLSGQHFKKPITLSSKAPMAHPSIAKPTKPRKKGRSFQSQHQNPHLPRCDLRTDRGKNNKNSSIMAGLFTYSVAGLGFLLVAAIETLTPFRSPLTLTLNLPFIRYLSISILSSLFILYSLLSSLSSPSGDPLSPALPLSAAAAAAPFLLYSLSGLLLPHLLSPLLPLLALFAFFQELLFLYHRRKDVDGIENRYFDLLLVPVLVCLASTLASLARPRSAAPRVARAAGLALHGTWLIQMGFSSFSSVIAHGCFLHRRSWANFTVRCKGHPEFHRARAIATLQFNCHLALLVVVAVGVYSMAVRLGEARRGGEGYTALNKELQRMEGGKFSLEDEDEEQEIKIEDVDVRVAETRNGFIGSH